MKRAFSLAEVILSTLILSLVTLSLFTLFPSSALAVKKGENRLTAESLAQAGLEECRALPFNLLSAGLYDLGNVTLGPVVFERKREIFTPPGSADDKLLKGVRVTVSWERERLVRETWIPHVER